MSKIIPTKSSFVHLRKEEEPAYDEDTMSHPEGPQNALEIDPLFSFLFKSFNHRVCRKSTQWRLLKFTRIFGNPIAIQFHGALRSKGELEMHHLGQKLGSKKKFRLLICSLDFELECTKKTWNPLNLTTSTIWSPTFQDWDQPKVKHTISNHYASLYERSAWIR